VIETPLASTVIRSISYDPALKLATFVLHDGSRHAIAPFSADEYFAFMAAPSKGTHYFKHVFPRLTQSPAPAAGQPIKLREPEPLAPPEFFQHDSCCTPRLQKTDRTGLSSWECPKCGTAWKKIRRGDVFNWEPDAAFFLHPMRS
jgi:hypothetical protein